MRYLSFLFCWLILSSCPSLSAAPADRPNILWVVSEDNDIFLGCYGDKTAHTPTLDKLAREGVLFERCFAWPVCAPSRFTLISGMYPTSCGPAEHMRASGKIPSWLKGFPALLRAQGYFTSNNAKTDYNSPIKIKEAWNAEGKEAHWRKRPEATQPFFSVFNHEVTHESCLFPEKELPLDFPSLDPALVRIPPYQPDTPEMRADWVRYYNHMRLMDGQIAKKLADLEKDGLSENTIVFYYSDNGGVLPRSKRFLQESGIHVPLIVYFPPKWRHLAPAAPGSRISDPVSFVDFAPTILSLTGVPIPSYMEGQAFAGPAKAPPRDHVIITRDRMDSRYDMMRTVVDSRWLYIRNFRPDLPYVQPLEYQFRARGYQSWARVAAEGKLTPATAQFWGPKPTEELYDMQTDPDSVHNLAFNADQLPRLQAMRAKLETHVLKTKDNGLLPEGSALEGYNASHAADAWPIAETFHTALLASERNPQNLPALIQAMHHASEPMRWWAAQGCTMLGAAAQPAQAELEKLLNDPSGAVQVVAAEALVRLNQPALALPVLEKWIRAKNQDGTTQQASNVVDRLGEIARPLLPAMKEAIAATSPEKVDGRYPATYTLNHAVDVLEGRTAALVYPPTPTYPLILK